MGDLFGGAAPYYAKYRPGYGDEAIAFLAGALGPDARVLDLGCGPGTVAIPLAPRVREVIAVDPDAEMLAEGRRLGAGITNIHWMSGDSTMLRKFPTFGHVVMGRSFHWMDRRGVLAELGELLPPDGIVALIGPARDPDFQPWDPLMERLHAEFGLGPMSAGNSFQATGEHHHDVLAVSPFSRLESVTFEQRLTWDVESVIGLQLSYSYSTPARLGDRVPAFVDRAMAALLAENPSGTWEQRVTTEVLLARRP
ncbi:methyltransferase domain-containing protein [Nonomuraea sp. NN258]|uniref:class I SAM-dependent methyltransferase n=1 Tax=Nonomuraea antri TaxID=2730852 RepID=UPI00156A0FE1|nr:class I SAM-dependent methyltransferase [Nonomuraea antri]NRQ36759.1 methyltransferase domain-containing protein [Nonomuraea antri]